MGGDHSFVLLEGEHQVEEVEGREEGPTPGRGVVGDLSRARRGTKSHRHTLL